MIPAKIRPAPGPALRTMYWLPGLVLGPLLLGGALARSRPQQGPPRDAPAVPAGAARLDVSAVDSSVAPCDDFYRYACGKWMAENPIPPDQPAWSHGAQLAEWNRQMLHEILDRAAADNPKRDATEQKIGDYYAACVDDEAIEQRGTASGALKEELGRIAALTDKAQLAPEVAHLHQLTGVMLGGTDSGARTPLFGFGAGQDLDHASQVVASVDQGGLGLPDRDYYLKTDAKSVKLRQQYQGHVQRMLALLGEPAAQAHRDAATVLDIESALARSSMDIVKRRDPANVNHKLQLAELKALSPTFDWGRYLQDLAPPQTPHYLVMTPEFFRGLEAELRSRPLAEWQTYLRWHLVHAAAPLLPVALQDEDFAFYGKTLRGQKEQRPRWKRCVSMVDRDLGEALGQAYVKRTFGDEGKRRTLELVHAVEKAMAADIRQLEWMTPATRTAALAKLAAIEDKIGFPSRWRDYSSVRIARGDALGNAFRSGAFELRRQLDKIGKPVDRVEWDMTPPTVNAYYQPQLNTINFPAGILQPPFFDGQADDAMNFGSIGSVIGHELTHGFDDQGRKFDKQGDLHDWWTAADAKAFDGRARCLAEQYSGYVATGDVKVNGELTLGENTADNGGVRVALMALRSVLAERALAPGTAAPGTGAHELTPEQRFFIAYGQTWCANYSPELLRVLAASNPHSPPQYRVNGVLSNMPEFQQAFGCKKGQPMAPVRSCRVW